MAIKFVDLKLKREFDKILILHYCHFILLLMLLLIEVVNGFAGILATLVKTILILVIYRMYIKTMKNFYYTFWTFSIFVALYIIMGLWQGFFVFNYDPISWLYFLAAFCLSIECYLISSPLYFPRISWWEFDFRYRDDIKVGIKINDKELEGRLTDLRRGAGCIVLFEDLKSGDFINLKTHEGEISLVAEIISRRLNTVGRGVIYGVKFHFDKTEDKNNFYSLCRFFEEKKRSAKKMKYHKFKSKKESN